MTLRQLVAKLVPHTNPRCMAPPGRLTASAGRPIIVSSMMRTGTHLLIDLILNNFPAYRRAPLYVDLDQYASSTLPVDELLSCGSYVIKTHYPQSKAAEKLIRRLAERAFVIQPARNLKDVYRSLLSFGGEARSYERLEEERAEFYEFWRAYDALSVGFDELIDTERVPSVIRRIAQLSGAERSGRTILPLGRSEVNKVLALKLATRLLGRYSPHINTTVQFATPESERTLHTIRS